MGLLFPLYRKPVTPAQPDRCKCGHAMQMHGAHCQITGCKCRQFRFPTK